MSLNKKIKIHIRNIKGIEEDKTQTLKQINQYTEEINDILKTNIDGIVESETKKINSYNTIEVMEDNYIQRLNSVEVELNFQTNKYIMSKSNRLTTTEHFNNNHLKHKEDNIVYHNVKQINNLLDNMEENNRQINKTYKTINILSNQEEDYDEDENIENIKSILLEVFTNHFLQEYNNYSKNIFIKVKSKLGLTEQEIVSIKEKDFENLLLQKYESTHHSKIIQEFREDFRSVKKTIEFYKLFKEELDRFIEDYIEEKVNEFIIEQQRIGYESIKDNLQKNQNKFFLEIKKRFYTPFSTKYLV